MKAKFFFVRLILNFSLFCTVLSIVLMLPIEVYALQGEMPKSWSESMWSLTSVPELVLPPVETEYLMKRQEESQDPSPLVFAVPHEVSLTPDTYGFWEKIEGGHLWRVRVYCPKGSDINLGFSTYKMPRGGSLHLYSECEEYYQGPYTEKHNKEHKNLWLPAVPCDRAVVEVFLPHDSDNKKLELELTHVNCGFLDIFKRRTSEYNNNKQGDCNIDVICPEASILENQIRSVARYSISGKYLCTGTLIMDTEKSFRNFFLTANHCNINEDNESTLVFYWNYESPRCGQLDGGSLEYNQTGAVFRAAHKGVDMALVELDEKPDPAFNVFYSGWDRSENLSPGSASIHHPYAREKAISFNYNPLLPTDSCTNSGGTNSHWKVDNWEKGTTEKGSSGSCLWNINTKRCVGFLSGGLASCNYPDGFDCYGKFSAAWDRGNTASERLKDWLDPNNTDITAVDGINPNGKYRFTIKKIIIKQKNSFDKLKMKIKDAEGLDIIISNLDKTDLIISLESLSDDLPVKFYEFTLKSSEFIQSKNKAKIITELFKLKLNKKKKTIKFYHKKMILGIIPSPYIKLTIEAPDITHRYEYLGKWTIKKKANGTVLYKIKNQVVYP